jgi:hypothetical protein
MTYELTKAQKDGKWMGVKKASSEKVNNKDKCYDDYKMLEALFGG